MKMSFKIKQSFTAKKCSLWGTLKSRGKKRYEDSKIFFFLKFSSLRKKSRIIVRNRLSPKIKLETYFHSKVCNNKFKSHFPIDTDNFNNAKKNYIFSPY